MRTDLLKIRDWILKECDGEINWNYLSQNPRAIHLLRENPKKIRWNVDIYYNHAAVELLDLLPEFTEYRLNNGVVCDLGCLEQINIFDEEEKKELEEKTLKYFLNELTKFPSNLENLTFQPLAISIIEKNLDKIDWDDLSENPAALHLLENNLNKINWYHLSFNENPKILEFINKHLDKLDYSGYYNSKKINFNILCSNSKVIPLLEANKDKINNKLLMCNINAMHLIEERINQLSNYCLKILSVNPGAIELLKKYPNIIDRKSIWANPMIFTYDYDKINGIFADLNKEYYEIFYHPKRMNMWNWTMDE
jgi:hypothetical protein